MANDNFKDDDEVIYDTVELDIGEGKTLECGVLQIFPYGEKDYIALFPINQDDDGYFNIYYYEYNEDDNGNPILTNIEDDDEYEAVADTFDEMLDSMEYDEIVGEDEEDI
ncbi:Protein of unknown function [Lachnospiraceae bacterium RM5]|nr:Protein of unknown function [Lachnospiraceae bacterium RM5]